ncbi:MAG: hypothetical protein Q4B54_09605, partial [Coriobacteriales bacterium]|nr:hypothetical protein [Coriobacteriales bacterium]
MKRTQFTDLRATIRATFVSFFSIMMFVALAVAIFLGIDWSGKALEAAAENTYSQNSFHDVEILFPYGLSASDLRELSKVEGVSEVEAGQVSFESARHNGSEYSMRVGSITTKIDKLVVKDGKLPTSDGEMAVEARWAARHKAKLGDTIELVGRDSDSQPLKKNRFTITALVESPAYLSNSANTWGASSSSTGAIDVLAWIPLSGFNADYYKDGNTQVLVRADALRQWPTLSESYNNNAKPLVDSIKQLGAKLSIARQQTFANDADSKVSEAEQKLADAKKELADAEQ